MTALSPDRPSLGAPMTAMIAAAIVLALAALSVGDGASERAATTRPDRQEASARQSVTLAPRGDRAIAISLPIGVTGPETRLLDRQHTMPRQPDGGREPGESADRNQAGPLAVERASATQL
jgi:hypothetical protein